MKVLFCAIFLVLCSGCASCVSCFSSDVKTLVHQDRESAIGIRQHISEFAREEFAGVRGLRRDFTAGASSEEHSPQYYFGTLSEIFCPCP